MKSWARWGPAAWARSTRPRDVRLNRLVAIKVLPAALAADADLRQRLEREARAVAALQHPHICTLHDIGHQNGIDFLVMEYLEGQTLAEHLRKGAFPVDRTIQYALQIADALDQAHRAGIVHRDLKPGNIMLTPSGIKLLDFGLAKLRPQLAVGGFGSDVTETAPLAAPLTGSATFSARSPTWPRSRSKGRTPITVPTSGPSAASSTRWRQAARRFRG